VRGYFSQLMRQTGVKIAGTAPFPESLPAPGAPSAHDVEIEESSFTPSTGVVTQSGVFQSESTPIGSQPRSHVDAPLETESKIGRDADALRESHVSFEATIETADAAAASSSAAIPAASPLASNAAPSRSTVIQEVMDWIAEPAPVETDSAKSVMSPLRVATAAPAAREALEDDRRLVPSESPASALSFHQTVEHARSDRAPAAKSGDEAWSVHIGAIHLEIEAPGEKPSPRPVALRPASPAASEGRGSRLRRYYLRSC
jgi:hypothetical protein